MEDYKKLSLDELLKLENDPNAWYWIGMAYWKEGDFNNAAVWLEKTMNDLGNEWANKARFNLALSHKSGLHSQANKDEALRLFEKNLSGSMSNLHAGFLYYDGTETKCDPIKGKELIEKAIELLIEEDGDDEYLAPDECFNIAIMYAQEGNRTKAIEYFKKAHDRVDPNHPLRKMAEDNIRELGE
jgi:tetratricopeptide (TPR) repeat protein